MCYALHIDWHQDRYVLSFIDEEQRFGIREENDHSFVFDSRKFYDVHQSHPYHYQTFEETAVRTHIYIARYILIYVRIYASICL